MKRTAALIILVVLVFLAIMAGLSIASVDKADAAVFGGSLKHSADDGYDDPILVRCDNASGQPDTYGIREGKDSDDICPSEDVNYVYVRFNEELWCYYGSQGWSKRADGNGWHPWGEYENRYCVLHRD